MDMEMTASMRTRIEMFDNSVIAVMFLRFAWNHYAYASAIFDAIEYNRIVCPFECGGAFIESV